MPILKRLLRGANQRECDWTVERINENVIGRRRRPCGLVDTGHALWRGAGGEELSSVLGAVRSIGRSMPRVGVRRRERVKRGARVEALRRPVRGARGWSAVGGALRGPEPQRAHHVRHVRRRRAALLGTRRRRRVRAFFV